MPDVRSRRRLHRLSKRTSPLLTSTLTVERLRSPALWDDLLVQRDGYGRWARRKLAAYRELLDCGEVGEMVDDYAAGRLVLGPPTRRLINKADGRKKVVFTFAAADELFLKALNRILQVTTAGDHSRLCHSFQPGPRSGSARGISQGHNRRPGEGRRVLRT